jgi:hypothetical protein
MPGNIWNALGAALQTGVRTHAELSDQEKAEKLRQAQLAMEQERMGFQRRQLEGDEQERRYKIIQNAIEGADPNQEFDPALYDEAQKFGLGGRFNTKPVAKDVQLPASGINIGEQINTLTNPGDHVGAFRRQSPKELMESEGVAAVNGLPPEQRKRLLIGATTGIQGSELNTVLGLPTGSKGATPNTDALVQTIVRNPAAYDKLPAQLQTQIAGPLAEAGFKFGDAPKPPSAYLEERSVRMRDAVQELRDLTSNWTVGYGSLLKNLPATEAKNYAAKLKTLTANIAFQELAEMREASKTGGALGNVSNIELELLSSVRGALDQAQDVDSILAELDKVEESLNRWEAEKKKHGWVSSAGTAAEQDVEETTPSARTQGLGSGNAIPQMTDGFKPGPVGPVAAPAPTPALKAFGNPAPQMKSGAFTVADAAKQAQSNYNAKTVTAAEVNAFARDMRISPKEAARQLQAEGYIIGR